MTLTKEDLIAFEDSIAAEFNEGQIRHPVHLESGNEDALIEIFKHVRPFDWVYGSWRMHSKAFLKIGLESFDSPQDVVRLAIYRGESMALRIPKYRVYGSAIVGGTLPIALGTAMSIKRRGGNEKVWVFVGDMGAEAGSFEESSKYAANHDLAVEWIIEDNGVSVLTPTKEVWGEQKPRRIRRYHYNSKWPHAGAGKRIEF